MEGIAEICASVATTLAAVLVAVNLRAWVTGIGFVIFAIGSVAWIFVAVFTDQTALLWQNIALLVINLVGVWRWLGIRARYERGAESATGEAPE